MPILRILVGLPCLGLVIAYAKLGGRLPMFVDLPSREQIIETLRDAIVDTAFGIDRDA